MKKLLLSLLATGLLFTNLSFGQIDLNELGYKISTRKDFTELINQLSLFSDSPKNFELIKELGKKEKLNEDDKQILLNSLGFKSQETAYEFDINNHNIIKRIYEELKLNSLTKNEQLEVFIAAINNIPNNVLESVSDRGRTCLQKFKSCKTGAWGIYIVEQAGCISAGVGVGALSFYCAGCAGAALYSACATGASMHMSSMLDDCKDAYDACLQTLN
jgi:hypothetical protein